MSKNIACVALMALAHTIFAANSEAQAARSLTLAEARSLARAASPELAAAREAVEVARGLEMQAAAFANPSFSFSTERVSGAGQTNRERIAGLAQPLEIGGQRGMRREIANLRTQAGEARLQAAEARLDFEVANLYALAVAADRRASLARSASLAFTEAARVSEQRLAAGDISVYADRRLRLEAARYGALEAEARLASRGSRVALSALISASPDSLAPIEAVLADSIPAVRQVAGTDAMKMAALLARPDLRAASLEADARAGEARLAARAHADARDFRGTQVRGIRGKPRAFAWVFCRLLASAPTVGPAARSDQGG